MLKILFFQLFVTFIYYTNIFSLFFKNFILPYAVQWCCQCQVFERDMEILYKYFFSDFFWRSDSRGLLFAGIKGRGTHTNDFVQSYCFLPRGEWDHARNIQITGVSAHTCNDLSLWCKLRRTSSSMHCTECSAEVRDRINLHRLIPSIYNFARRTTAPMYEKCIKRNIVCIYF